MKKTIIHHIIIHVAAASGAVFIVFAAIGVQAAFKFDATVPFEPRVEKTIDRGQAWIVSMQQPNGSWGNCNGRNALAAMALMVNGTTPGFGKYGVNVAKAVDFILNCQQENGYLAIGNQNMYQHALATLCLAEAYGMSHNPAIRKTLVKAVDLILRAQTPAGGWRYTPEPRDADLSVTVMQVMALRACTEVGLFVPKETLDLAVRWVRSCWGESIGSFGYSGTGNEISVPRAGAGVVCLQSCGQHSDPIIPKAIKHIMTNVKYNNSGGHYWYGQYYSSIALYHYGGDSWKKYYPQITEMVIKAWHNTPTFGDILDTAWAILVIGVPYRYLPVYQE